MKKPGKKLQGIGELQKGSRGGLASWSADEANGGKEQKAKNEKRR